MDTHGKDFASIYDDRRRRRGEKAWPMLAAIARGECPHGQRWLDLCCGGGWLLQHVCSAGYEGVGLDACEHQLHHARRNAPKARFVHADVRGFDLGRAFDVVTCLCDSLNHLTVKRDFVRAVRAAKRHLAPGGRFVFDVAALEHLLARPHHTRSIHEPHRVLIVRSDCDAKRALRRVRITGFVLHGRLWRRFEEVHVQRGYRPEEVEDMLARCGLAWRKLDGDTFGRVKKSSRRLLYVCRQAVSS